MVNTTTSALRAEMERQKNIFVIQSFMVSVRNKDMPFLMDVSENGG